MNAHPRAQSRSKGLSLVELMVAIALGGLLLGGAVSLFVNNRATYEVTNDMARLQENARFALQTMVADVRMAGYTGCVNDLTKVNNNTGATAGELVDPTNAIEGFDAGDATWSPSAFAVTGVLANTDGMTLRYLVGDRDDLDGDADTLPATDDPDLRLVNSVSSASTEINVDSFRGTYAVDLPATISDCGGVDVFLVTATDTDGITANGLSRAYDPINEALIAPYVGVRYSVQNNAANVPSLFRASLVANPGGIPNEQAEELVDGVQNLQLLYGVDTNGDSIPDNFLSAGDAGLQTRNEWLSVVAVRISLLMSTIDEFGSDTDDNVYLVGNERICRTGLVPAPVPACTITFAPDRRRRRVFQATVAVRNMQ